MAPGHFKKSKQRDALTFNVDVPEAFVLIRLFQLFNTEDYAAARRSERFPAPATAVPPAGGPLAPGAQRASAASTSATTGAHPATAEREPCAAVTATASTRPDTENAVTTPEVANNLELRKPLTSQPIISKDRTYNILVFCTHLMLGNANYMRCMGKLPALRYFHNLALLVHLIAFTIISYF